MKILFVRFIVLGVLGFYSVKAMEMQESEEVQKAIVIKNIQISGAEYFNLKSFRIVGPFVDNEIDLSTIDEYLCRKYTFNPPLIFCSSFGLAVLVSESFSKSDFHILDGTTRFVLTCTRSMVFPPKEDSWWPYSTKCVEFQGNFLFKDYMSCLSNGMFDLKLKFDEKHACVNNKILGLALAQNINESESKENRKTK